VATYRERWKNEVRIYIKKLPQVVRAAAEELWRNMEQGAHGEYACCGVYLKSFCEGLTRADVELDKKNKGAIMRLLKIIGKGARETLKIHTGIKEVSRSKNLAQTSIKRYFKRKDNPVTVETDIVKESTRLMKRNKKRYKYINPESSE
jgi:ribosomal protein S13